MRDLSGIKPKKTNILYVAVYKHIRYISRDNLLTGLTSKNKGGGGDNKTAAATTSNYW